jgi:hypothetical protein
MVHGKPEVSPVQGVRVSSAATAYSRPLADAAAVAIRRNSDYLFNASIVLFLVLTRVAVAPRYLFYFDSANFALALEDFNPAMHRPQPPGYPLFVLLTRLLHAFISSPERVMLVAGLIGAIAAVWLTRALASMMFGEKAGILAMVLLASDPVFWFGGVTNQIRIFLAVTAAGIGLLAWRALSRPAEPARLHILFAGMGLFAGFRPIEAWLFLPLALWVWWRADRSWRRLGIAALAATATTIPWLAPTIIASGGPVKFLGTLTQYAGDQFEGTSALFGAPGPAAWHMGLQAIGWTFIGAIVWAWAMPFLPWKKNTRGRRRLMFLALAFLPTFLFSMIVHVGDPDQVLAEVTILCVAGGLVLAQLVRRAAPGRVYTAAALVAVVHIWAFYRSPYHIAEAASYGAVRNVDRMVSDAIGALNDLRADGPLTIVHYGSAVSWRQIAYYFPDDYVNVINGDGAPVFVYYKHRELPQTRNGRLRPESRRVVCLASPALTSASFPGWRKSGPLWVLDGDFPDGIHWRDFSLLYEKP